MRKIISLLGMCLVAFSLNAAVLMENSVPRCVVVSQPDAGAVEKHAASELVQFLAKISGGKAPEIVAAPRSDFYNIRYELVKDSKIAEDGFIIDAGVKECVIRARNPIGFLYGSYEILKRFGGIRWLTPGADGEYFTVKPTITLPEGKIEGKPSFSFRNINWACASTRSPKWDSFDWMVRNNLGIYELHWVYLAPALKPGLEARGAEIQDGGHCFSDLLGGCYLDDLNWNTPRLYQKFQERLQLLFREHPEYFPMINGKRVFLDDHKYQPCTSNPEVRRIMGQNMARMLKEWCSQTPRGDYRIVNNDGTGWCQCPDCQKSDPANTPAAGKLTFRYWNFVNAISEEALKAVPEGRIRATAYQNFEAAPTIEKPDRRIQVDLSFNRICYRHRIDDPGCPTNTRYATQYRDWSKIGNTLTAYAQIDSASGMYFMPIEETMTHALKFYHQLGISGIRPQIPPVDGLYSKTYDGRDNIKECHYAMWQTLYLLALFSWDINSDYAKTYEEINTLYYGRAAWENGMREFRKLLIKASSETPGCFGHGHSSPLGRCLEQAGVKEKLLAYLDTAEKAAATDSDPRALAHVKRDRKFFERTWIHFNDEFRKNYREICSYHRQAPIVIDGKLDEADWKNADSISGFKRASDGKPAENQTFVRIVHEPENIYFGIEAMEPLPDKMLNAVKEHDGEVWRDNTLELMITHPDLGNAYYHLIFNAAGVCYDRFVKPGNPPDAKFNANAEAKTSILKDRWILEVRIPTAPLGEKCFDGQAWKVNVLRSRKIEGQLDPSGNATESSTWSIGSAHSTDVFHPVNFCAKRTVSEAARAEVDPRIWKNGSFNEVARKPAPSNPNWPIKDGVMPDSWTIAGRSGEVSLESMPDNPDNRYMSFRGTIINEYYGKASKVRVSLRVRGNSKLYLSWYCYEVTNGKREFKKNIFFAEQKINSDEWQNLRFETDLPVADLKKLAVTADPRKLDLDDVMIDILEQ